MKEGGGNFILLFIYILEEMSLRMILIYIINNNIKSLFISHYYID